MSFDVERVKKINDKTKKLVSGYIHESENELFVKEDDPDPFHIIPELVIFMCLLFYEMDEIFDKQNPSKIKISGNRNHILTKLD